MLSQFVNKVKRQAKKERRSRFRKSNKKYEQNTVGLPTVNSDDNTVVLATVNSDEDVIPCHIFGFDDYHQEGDILFERGCILPDQTVDDGNQDDDLSSSGERTLDQLVTNSDDDSSSVLFVDEDTEATPPRRPCRVVPLDSSKSKDVNLWDDSDEADDELEPTGLLDQFELHDLKRTLVLPSVPTSWEGEKSSSDIKTDIEMVATTRQNLADLKSHQRYETKNSTVVKVQGSKTPPRNTTTTKTLCTRFEKPTSLSARTIVSGTWEDKPEKASPAQPDLPAQVETVAAKRQKYLAEVERVQNTPPRDNPRTTSTTRRFEKVVSPTAKSILSGTWDDTVERSSPTREQPAPMTHTETVETTRQNLADRESHPTYQGKQEKKTLKVQASRTPPRVINTTKRSNTRFEKPVSPEKSSPDQDQSALMANNETVATTRQNLEVSEVHQTYEKKKNEKNNATQHARFEKPTSAAAKNIVSGTWDDSGVKIPSDTTVPSTAYPPRGKKNPANNNLVTGCWDEGGVKVPSLATDRRLAAELAQAEAKVAVDDAEDALERNIAKALHELTEVRKTLATATDELDRISREESEARAIYEGTDFSMEEMVRKQLHQYYLTASERRKHAKIQHEVARRALDKTKASYEGTVRDSIFAMDKARAAKKEADAKLEQSRQTEQDADRAYEESIIAAQIVNRKEEEQQIKVQESLEQEEASSGVVEKREEEGQTKQVPEEEEHVADPTDLLEEEEQQTIQTTDVLEEEEEKKGEEVKAEAEEEEKKEEVESETSWEEIVQTEEDVDAMVAAQVLKEEEERKRRQEEEEEADEYGFDDEPPHMTFGMFDANKFQEQMLASAGTEVDSEDDTRWMTANQTLSSEDTDDSEEKKEEETELVKMFESANLLHMSMDEATEYLKKMEQAIVSGAAPVNTESTSPQMNGHGTPQSLPDTGSSVVEKRGMNGVRWADEEHQSSKDVTEQSSDDSDGSSSLERMEHNGFRSTWPEEDYQIKAFQGHDERVCSVVAFGDGRFISGSDNGSVMMHDVESGDCQSTFHGHTDSVYSLAVLDSYRFLSASDDETIKLWNVETGECLRTYHGHKDRVTSVASFVNSKFDTIDLRDDRFLTGSDDKSIRLWSVSSGKCIKLYNGHGRVHAVAVLGNRRFVSGSDDGKIRLWSISMGKATRKFQHKSVLSFAVIDADRFISGSLDKSIKVWDANKTECIHTFIGHFGGVWSVSKFENDHKLVSGSSDGTIRVWDINSGACTLTLEGHSGVVTAVATMGSDIITAGALDGSLNMWRSR